MTTSELWWWYINQKKLQKIYMLTFLHTHKKKSGKIPEISSRIMGFKMSHAIPMWRPFMMPPQSFASFSWFFYNYVLLYIMCTWVRFKIFVTKFFLYSTHEWKWKIEMKMKNNHPKILSALVHIPQTVLLLKTAWFFAIFPPS